MNLSGSVQSHMCQREKFVQSEAQASMDLEL